MRTGGLDEAAFACSDVAGGRAYDSQPPSRREVVLVLLSMTTRAVGRPAGAGPGSRTRNFTSMHRFTIEVFTEGNTDIVNLHPELANRLRDLKV
jgi:hypothetical protein